MTHDDPADQRLTELEIKASFSEDLLDQLSLVIVRQQADGAAYGGGYAESDRNPNYSRLKSR